MESVEEECSSPPVPHASSVSTGKRSTNQCYGNTLPKRITTSLISSRRVGVDGIPRPSSSSHSVLDENVRVSRSSLTTCGSVTDADQNGRPPRIVDC